MRITLGDHIVEINERTTTNNQHRVLTSSQKGIVSQDEYFNKQIASKENTGYKIVKRGQFTYRAMSDTGRFYINRLMEYDVGIVSPAYPVFEVIEDNIIYTPYIVLFFESDYFQSLIVNQSTGSTRVSLKLEKIKRISIDIPSYQEQKEIVEKIESAKRAIAARDEQLSCFNELVKSRFIELFGDPLINEKGWTVSKLGEYMTLLTDFSSNGSYELLDSNVVMYDEPNYAIMVRTTDLESGNLSDGVKYIDRNAYELLAKSKIYGGELIMNKIGSAGKIYVMPKIDRPASLGRNAFMFRFDERLNMTYLYSLLTSDYGTAEIQQYVRGAVTKTITKESTRSIRIIVPPIALQEQFASFVEQTDKSKLYGEMEVAA